MVLSSLLVVVSVFVFLANGLNFGIDFRGGTLIEASSEGALSGRIARPFGRTRRARRKFKNSAKRRMCLFGLPKEGATDASINLSAVEQVREKLSSDLTSVGLKLSACKSVPSLFKPVLWQCWSQSPHVYLYLVPL